MCCRDIHLFLSKSVFPYFGLLLHILRIIYKFVTPHIRLASSNHVGYHAPRTGSISDLGERVR